MKPQYSYPKQTSFEDESKPVKLFELFDKVFNVLDGKPAQFTNSIGYTTHVRSSYSELNPDVKMLSHFRGGIFSIILYNPKEEMIAGRWHYNLEMPAIQIQATLEDISEHL